MLPRAALVTTRIEHLAEKIAEDVANVDAARKRAAKSLAGSAHARMAVTVVRGALVRVAQHLVRLARLLESLFRGMIAGITVRMILERQLAIGTLQLLVAGLARDAQNLVVICSAHCQLYSTVCFGLVTTRTIAGRNSRSRNL